jgi:cytoskeleton protein RodZ
MSELGTLLVRAREARGLTLEDAERDTRISRRYLQALEAEQFEAIPAPVYARGFLRSYSQYLGLDPQEMLAMFPREEDQIAAAQQAATQAGGSRSTRQQPQSAVGPARPTWRAPQPGNQTQRSQSAPTRQAPVEPELPMEPVIGVDIGVPAPARRIKADPAAQTRSVMIAVVAIGAVLAVVLLAFLISNLGGGPSTPGPGASATGAATGSAGPTTGPTLAPSGIQTTPGVVPSLTGLTAEKARAAISEAGFKSNETHAKNAATKGTVFDQSPAAGGSLPVGKTVTIVISDGP